MHELIYLKDLVIIMGIGVIIVALFHRFKFPTIAGFIVAGMIVGPKGLALINDIHQVEVLSEIGVTLLLFGIGLEFPLDRFKRIWRLVIIGGFVQVGLTILITYMILRFMDYSFESSVLVGFVMAVSSTAIVLKGLDQRGEIDAPHGRMTMGILIFQDLCVVPMILIIPMLAQSESSAAGEILMPIIRSLLIIFVVLAAARYLIPKLLDMVAKTRQRQLFIMAVLLICVGTAWISASIGISLALGAFLAGLLVGGSEYRHQAMADIFSFRELFISIFFVSVGMLLDTGNIIPNMGGILLILFGIVFGKFIIVFLVGLMLKMPVRVSSMSGAALAQIGEFSFVMLGVAAGYQFLDSSLSNDLMTAAVFSMLLTPFALTLAPKLAAGVEKFKMFDSLLNVKTASEAKEISNKLNSHVIIGGYGLAGRNLAGILREKNIPYIVADINPENVRHGVASGEPVCFGDITSPDVLKCLGIGRAEAFVVIINDQTALEQSIVAARSMSDELYILVRTRYLEDSDRLNQAGASDIIVAEVVTSEKIVEYILKKDSHTS